MVEQDGPASLAKFGCEHYDQAPAESNVSETVERYGKVNVRIREFLQYDYKDPAAWLRTMREIEPLISRSGLSERSRTLRTRSLRRWAEIRHAALFTYGMRQRMPGFFFDFAYVEREDYDAIVRLGREGEVYFMPLQLKEYVPSDISPEGRLDEVMAGLAKYGDSSDLFVSVYLNRRFRLNLQDLPRVDLKLGGLYFIGAAVPSKENWVLIGDVLGAPEMTFFDHP